MNLRIALVSTLLALLLSAGQSRAGYTFEFVDPTTSTASSQYVVGVGQTVTIDVYVAQTGTSTGLTSSGLNSGGVQLNTSAPAYATVTAATPNAAFDSSTSATGSSASVTVNQLYSNPVAPSSSPAALSNAVLLGAFTFAGQSAGSTVTVTAVPTTGASVNVLGNGTAIDSMLAQNPVSASITVVAVPEPSTLVLAGLLASAMLGRYARRRGAIA